MNGKFIVASALLALGLCGNAFADDCDTIAKSKEWKAAFTSVKIAFESGLYDKVLTTGEEMNYICARSPELNYYIGASYAAIGDLENAKVYLQIASEATYEFATKPELSKKIYYAWYEAENPDRAAQNVTDLKKELETTRAAIREIERKGSSKKSSLASSYANTGSMTSNTGTTFQNSGMSSSEYHTYMWSGIGVAAFGAVMTIVGGSLIGTVDKYKYAGIEEKIIEADDPHLGLNKGKAYIPTYKISSSFVAGWTILGIGMTATITGAILAGINGYKWKHANDETYSFGISPNSVHFEMTF